MGSPHAVGNIQQDTILFDGVCNLCNSSVQFIIRRDSRARFRFAALQSDAGQKLLETYALNSAELYSVVLVDSKQTYTRSTAALRIARSLDGAWPAFYVFIIIPRFIRDAVYDLIAKNRYRMFGKKDQCMIPTPALKARFLG